MSEATTSECTLPIAQEKLCGCMKSWLSTMNCPPTGDADTVTTTLWAQTCGVNARQQKTAAARTNLATTFLIKPDCAPERSYISDTRSLDSDVSIRVNPQKYTTNFGNGEIASHFDH